MHRSYLFGLLCIFSGSSLGTIKAQAPVLLARLPAVNAVAGARAAGVQLTFSQPMSAQAASPAAVKVTSAWRGRLPGTYAGAGTPTVSFTPAGAFWPGEPVQVTATSLATNLSGMGLTAAISYQFQAAVAGGTGSFPVPPDVALAGTPTYVAAADINGDGVPDLLTTLNSATNVGTVHVRLSNGLGGFLSSRDIAVGHRPVALATADVNGDSRADFVTANLNDNTVSVRYGDGLGGFAGAGSVSVGTGPVQVALGNFNADGYPDLVTANGVSNTVSVRLGDGVGGFAPPAAPLRAEIPVGTTPVDVGVGDVNRDGFLDFVTVNNAANGTAVTLSVRLGNGQGAFTGTDVPLANDPASLLLADVTGDGILDLLMPNVGNYSARGTVSVRAGSGQGSFGGTTEVSVARDPVRVAVGDVNGDGQLDLLTANRNFFYQSGTVSIRLGNGQGNFAGVTDLAVGIGPSGLVVGDLNRDGRPDLLTTSHFRSLILGGSSTRTVASVRLGDGRGSFEGPAEVEVGIGGNNNSSGDVSDVVVADVDHDGHLDLLTANANAHTVSVRLGDGRGQFRAGTEVGVGAGPWSVAVADVNSDGHLDVLTADAGSSLAPGNSVSVRLGDGRGGFSGSSAVPVGAGPLQVAAGDLNGDGNADLVTANYRAYSVSVRLGTGRGSFTAVPDVALRGRPTAVALGDANGDGKTDLLVADYDNAAVQIRLGNGAGGFTGTGTVPVGSRGGTPLAVAVGDLNNDGALDLVTANNLTQGSTGTASVRLGDGRGNFAGTTEVPVSLRTQQVALGDLNGDGVLDLLVATGEDGAVGVYLGTGTGAFAPGALVPTDAYPRAVALADVDNDGDLDVLAACFTGGTVSVRLNAGLGAPLAVDGRAPAPGSGRLAVFPNPARTTAVLRNAPAGAEATVYDNLGRQVRVFKAAEALDLSQLPEGLYLVRVGSQTVRLVVEP